MLTDISRLVLRQIGVGLHRNYEGMHADAARRESTNRCRSDDGSW